MKDILIVAGYFCVTGLMTFFGILMLIASDKSMGILYKLSGVNQFSQSYRSRSSWSRTQWRIGGLFLAGLSLYMLGLPIYWMSEHSSTQELLPLSAHASGRWIVLGAVLLIFVVGFCLAFRWWRKKPS